MEHEESKNLSSFLYYQQIINSIPKMLHFLYNEYQSRLKSNTWKYFQNSAFIDRNHFICK